MVRGTILQDRIRGIQGIFSREQMISSENHVRIFYYPATNGWFQSIVSWFKGEREYPETIPIANRKLETNPDYKSVDGVSQATYTIICDKFGRAPFAERTTGKDEDLIKTINDLRKDKQSLELEVQGLKAKTSQQTKDIEKQVAKSTELKRKPGTDQYGRPLPPMGGSFGYGPGNFQGGEDDE